MATSAHITLTTIQSTICDHNFFKRIECAINDYINNYACNDPFEFPIQSKQCLETPFYLLNLQLVPDYMYMKAIRSDCELDNHTAAKTE
eukprot:2373077-Amphidinium_carterae.1